MIYKCKMCGGTLEVKEGQTICECEYCGSVQTIPNLDDEKKIKLYERANRLRLNNEFDQAYGAYQQIVSDWPDEAEAFWGLVLCKYGIEYVEDSTTQKRVPTCHRSSFESVMEDADFDMVMQNADSEAKALYRAEAKTIDELRKRINEVSSKEEPYDIFICYKETDKKGERTIDSVLAQDVYKALTDKGYKVFFSKISLEDKLGQEYEPYIFAALNSAKVMLVFGTDYDYFNAVWVKNEWSRFLQLMTKDKNKYLIPCYMGVDAYDMPKEFNKLQAQDMCKVGAIQDLVRGIEKLIDTEKTTKTEFSSKEKDMLYEMAKENELRRKESKELVLSIILCIIFAIVIYFFMTMICNVHNDIYKMRVWGFLAHKMPPLVSELFCLTISMNLAAGFIKKFRGKFFGVLSYFNLFFSLAFAVVMKMNDFSLGYSALALISISIIPSLIHIFVSSSKKYVAVIPVILIIFFSADSFINKRIGEMKGNSTNLVYIQNDTKVVRIVSENGHISNYSYGVSVCYFPKGVYLKISGKNDNYYTIISRKGEIVYLEIADLRR